MLKEYHAARILLGRTVCVSIPTRIGHNTTSRLMLDIACPCLGSKGRKTLLTVVWYGRDNAKHD